jgi:hypothetical protein
MYGHISAFLDCRRADAATLRDITDPGAPRPQQLYSICSSAFGRPTGGQIEQSPKRLHSSQVTHILPGISRRMDQLACPVQPDDPVRIAPEHCHDRHGLSIWAIAAVVSTKVIRAADTSLVCFHPFSRAKLPPRRSCSRCNDQVPPEALESAAWSLPTYRSGLCRMGRSLIGEVVPRKARGWARRSSRECRGKH